MFDGPHQGPCPKDNAGKCGEDDASTIHPTHSLCSAAQNRRLSRHTDFDQYFSFYGTCQYSPGRSTDGTLKDVSQPRNPPIRPLAEAGRIPKQDKP